MRILMKAAVASSAVGLLALGAVAGSGGSALAATGQSVTGCSTLVGAVAAGLQPNCTAGNSRSDNPTSVTITLNTTALSELRAASPNLGLKATWTLSCAVNGATVSAPGSYTVSSSTQSPSKMIVLQAAVKSPEPNQCTIVNLTVETTVALTAGAVGLKPFTIAVAATATTAVSGAIYQNAGTASSGAHAVLCADDTGNRNAGTRIQSYQCLSDLADYFVQTSSGQLVHNGDCMSVSGSGVFLSACTGASSQQWLQSTVGGQLKNKGSNSCLTAVSAKDGTALQVRSCTGKANQNWRIPDKSAAV